MTPPFTYQYIRHYNYYFSITYRISISPDMNNNNNIFQTEIQNTQTHARNAILIRKGLEYTLGNI